MATPRIDDFTFIGWRGRLHLATRRIAKLPPRPGVTGVARVIDGWETAPEPITTSAIFNAKPDADDAAAGYRALMDGSTVTAVTPLGDVHSVKVELVTTEISQTPTKTFRLVGTWTLQIEAAP